MIMQYAAASLVSENKTLAHPASVDSIPSSANQEDHVSMGTIGSRHAYQIITNVRGVLAIEAICGLQILYREDSFLYIGLWDLKSFYNLFDTLSLQYKRFKDMAWH